MSPLLQLDCLIKTRPGSTPAYIEERTAQNTLALDAMLGWVRSQKAIATADFAVGGFKEAKVCVDVI